MIKRLLFKVSDEKSLANDLSITALRVFTGLTMALAHGLGKFPPNDGLIQGVASMGFPAPVLFAWLAASAELIGGFLLALGLLTRPSALFIAVTMAVAAIQVHGADPFQKKELAFLYLFIALVFVFRGGSKFSLDRFTR